MSPPSTSPPGTEASAASSNAPGSASSSARDAPPGSVQGSVQSSVQDGDPLFERLEKLPAPALSPDAADRILRRTRDAFEREAASAQAPWRRVWASAWNGVLEPAFVAAVVLVYAGWGLTTSAALLADRRARSEVSVPRSAQIGPFRAFDALLTSKRC